MNVETEGTIKHNVNGNYKKFNELDLKGISLSVPKASANNKGSFNIYVNGPDSKAVYFNLGTADCPYYPILFNPRTENSKVSICLTVSDQNAALIKFFAELDEMIIAHIAQHSKEFLKTVHTVEQVRKKFTSPLRKNEEYNNRFLSVKIDLLGKSGYEFECWEVNEQKGRYASVTHERLEKASMVDCVLKLGLVYSINGRCGYTLDVPNMMKVATPKFERFPFFSESQARFVQCDQASLFDECEIEDVMLVDETNSDPKPNGSYKKNRERLYDEAEVEEEMEVEEQADNGATIEIDPCTLEPVAQVITKKRRIS